MAKITEMIGHKFGRITVTAFHSNHVNPSGKKVRRYVGKCDCGKDIVVRGVALRSGHTTSCGCLREEYIRNPHRLPENEAGLRLLSRVYRYSARKREIEWSLTDTEFRALVACVCWYCDRKPELRHLDRHNAPFVYLSANGIDRIDSSIGYTFGNSVSCCETCNYMKHDRPLSEFLVHINRLQHLADPLPIFAGVN